jgi:hypothetical protein
MAVLLLNIKYKIRWGVWRDIRLVLSYNPDLTERSLP